jgi:antibiotic biosynthesis monooxygenase (ABM) superfamily enzyme
MLELSIPRMIVNMRAARDIASVKKELHMYGTIARFRMKPGSEDRLRELSREYETLKIPGFVYEYIYRLDAGQNEYALVVAFDSKENYVANAKSPEQHQRYQKLRDLLEADPEWSDGEIVYAHRA